MESLLARATMCCSARRWRASTRLAIVCRICLLPMALTQTPSELPPAMALAVGERGRWLGQFNRQWAWVAQTLTRQSDGMPPDAETIWRGGRAGQRVEVLSRLRKIDPTKAREWLDRRLEARESWMRADAPGDIRGRPQRRR